MNFMVSVFVSSLLLVMTNNSQCDDFSNHVLTYTADAEGFMVNSHLIRAGDDVVVIDAQFTKSQALAVVEIIKKRGLNLKTIFITHAHPDHYFGLEYLVEAFPKALVLSHPSIIKRIKQSSAKYLENWKKSYGDKICSRIIIPLEYTEVHYTWNDRRLDIQLYPLAESEESIVLIDKKSGNVFAGDLLYSKVHLWLAEKHGAEWTKALDKLEDSIPNRSTLYPGHGPRGSKELIKENLRYLSYFKKIAAEEHSKDEAFHLIKSKFPDYALDIILKLSLD